MHPKRLKDSLFTAVLFGVTAIFSGLTACSRPQGGPSNANQGQAPSNFDADKYVTPRKIYPYDLKSAAKELVGKSMWVRPGAARAFYRYGATGADTNRKAGVLPTLGRLDVIGVVVQAVAVPMGPNLRIHRRELLAVFTAPWQPGQFAVPIATENGDSYTFNVNDQFFFEDPHNLYSHWPPEVWAAVDRHEARKGMNELQVSFAVGPEIASSGGPYGNRWARYGDAGGSTKVTFKDGKAVEIVRESK
jgi:hypothetical protein